MMRKLRIALIVDHPLRDLPGLSLIAYSLAQQNFDVFLVPMYAQERECLSLAPDFVLLNYLRKNNEVFAARLMDSNIQFGINDTEGGFYGDLSFYGNVLSRDQNLYDFLNCNLVWGKKVYSYLQKDFGIKQHCIITGLPRFDYYSEKYRNIDLNLLPQNLKTKNITLINTKVAVANPLFVTKEKEIDTYRNKLGISDEMIQHFLEYGAFSIQDNVALAKAIAKDFSSSQVVVRPHPHENAVTYSEQIDKMLYPNVGVYREGPIIPWILGSKCIIHRHCTTAIEAALAEIPALVPAWVRYSANAPDTEKVSHIAANKEELDELIRQSNNNKLKPSPAIKNELDRIIDEWLYQVDGASHLRVANAIAETLKPGMRPNLDKSRKQMYNIFDTKIDQTGKLYNIINKFSRVLPQPLWQIEKMRLNKWANTQKYFTPEDVANWITPVQVFEKTKTLSYSWARSKGEFLDNYPGSSIQISLTRVL